MGWFWADTVPSPRTPAAVAPHAIPQTSSGAPPPGCPMHTADTPSTAPFPPRADPSISQPPSSCPAKSPNNPLCSSPQKSEASSSSPSPPDNSSTLSKLNPLNFMPTLSNTRDNTSPQSVSLPLSRETSSIPRSDVASNWEYPSPQQMYNAMLRKGHTDTPAEDVESMVAVHNFLNEGAWAEIEDWENLFSRGLMKGWEVCQHGEEGIATARARREAIAVRREMLGLSPSRDEEPPKPTLIRFQGRPKTPTPKARLLGLLGSAFPSHFSQDPPFDRHDWYVSRHHTDGSTREVRYVIDYYGGGVEEESGQPVFYLDIRPALDGPTAVAERAIRWGGDVWYRASGGVAREAFARERQREGRS